MSNHAVLVQEFVEAANGSAQLFAALGRLSDHASDCYGQDAVDVSAEIRERGGLPLLVSCLDDPGIDVQQCVLSLLGNLLTDVYDPKARASLAIFEQAGGLSRLQQFLSAEFPIDLFAAAALQNITALDPEQCCAKLREMGCDSALAAMANADNEQVCSSARDLVCSAHD